MKNGVFLYMKDAQLMEVSQRANRLGMSKPALARAALELHAKLSDLSKGGRILVDRQDGSEPVEVIVIGLGIGGA